MAASINPTEDTAASARVEALECGSWRACSSYGIRREVPLQTVAPGVIARPAFVCADCGMELRRITGGGAEQ